MRRLAPALLLLMASCGQGDRGANRVSPPGNMAGPGPQQVRTPTIVIAATGPGNCSATWDGQAVTTEQIASRGFALVNQAVEAAGGIQNIHPDAIPVLNVQAPADLSIACADPILSAIQSSSMISVNLRSGDQAPILMDFPLDTNAPPPPIPTVLGIGAGGQITWNSDPIDAAGLTAQLTRIGGSPSSEIGEEVPPGGLELRVQREATVGQLTALLQTTRRHHLRPMVYLPSAAAGPSGAQVATPPPPPGAPPAPR